MGLDKGRGSNAGGGGVKSSSGLSNSGAKAANESGAQVAAAAAGSVECKTTTKCAPISKKETSIGSSSQLASNALDKCATNIKSDHKQREQPGDESAAPVISAQVTGSGHVTGARLLEAAQALDNNNDATFQVHGGNIAVKSLNLVTASESSPASDRQASSPAAAAAACDKETNCSSGGSSSKMQVDAAQGDQMAAARDNEQNYTGNSVAHLDEFKPATAAPPKATSVSDNAQVVPVGETRAIANHNNKDNNNKTTNDLNQQQKVVTSANNNKEPKANNSNKNDKNKQQETKTPSVIGDNYLSLSSEEKKRQQQQQQQQQETTIELGAAQHPNGLTPVTGGNNSTSVNQNKLGNNLNAFTSKNFTTKDTTAAAATNENLEDGTAPPPFDFIYNTSKRAVAPKRLSYFQSLLLRKWPCLALTICIMSSLIFGMLLSALTIFLLHDVSDCGQLALAAAASSAGEMSPSIGAQSSSHLHHHHHHHSVNLLPRELLRPTGDFALDAPIESASGISIAAAGSPPVDPLELAARQLARGDTNDTSLMASGGGSSNQATAFQRLPSALVPEHYNLFIWPHIAEPTFHFNGSLEIHLKCRSNTNNITLHTLDLELEANSIEILDMPSAVVSRRRRASQSDDSASKLASGGSSSSGLKVAKVSQDKQLQYSIIHLEGNLLAGRDYLLRLDFVGTLNDDLAGFYKIKYERQNSTETTWIAATQFQATDARRAFPCFDEPSYKATFSIKIKHWNNMTALSNMPIVKSEKSSDGLWITDTFAKSHRMSTYLVAWTVTNFESRSDGNISVWTRPGFGHTAEYALKIAGKILRHYEQFFGIEYPLPKMDMIALPDFNAGAMENWGLVTYRETAMLFDEATSTVANKQRVAVVVAHELAHQWFGNLVTPKWWDDLWLNEGFASFVEYIGVDHVEPKWRMLEQFVIEEVQNVFKVDGLSSSHQISIPVNNPDEISEIFDHISYAKGASIIRMMSHFLTEKVFKLGLQRYLRALKYNNAEQSDLWAHLTEAQRIVRENSTATTTSLKRSIEALDEAEEPVNVERVMNSWTLQTGFPLVTLTRTYADNEPVVATLDQIRYQPYKLISSANSTGGGGGHQTQVANVTQLANKQRWEIPITMTWKSELQWQPKTRLWMHQNQSEPVELKRSVAPLKSDEWIIMNVQQVGYYRVNYDQRNWRLLIAQLAEDHNKILPTNRAQILDDLFELAKSSLIDYRLAMEATKYLKNERDYLAWESVLISFGYIDEMLQRTPIYGAWQDYFAQMIEPYYARYKHLNWVQTNDTNNNRAGEPIDPNDVLESYNQNNAISWACQLNIEHCIGRAKKVFAEWRSSGKNNIKPALRYPTYCTAIEHGTKEDWDFLWRVYEREQGASERDRLLRALGCSKEIWILSRYLEWTFSKTKPIRRQDGAYVFRMIAKNNYGRDVAFNFMRERWATIKEYYGKTSFSLGHLIKSVATSMNTQVELDELKSFYESIKSDVGTGKRSFQIAIEEVESNVYWRDRNYKILENWLQGQQPALGA